MSNDIPDWEKKYWQRKQAQKQQGQHSPDAYTRMPQRNPEDLPHYDPVDISNQIAQRAAQGRPTQDGWKDIDPMTAMYMNQGALGARGMGPQAASQVAMLREGAVHYRAVDTESFGTTTPLVRNCGPIAGVNGREFELKGPTNCYIIDNMDVVDVGKLDESRAIQLVELKAPFVGSILVNAKDVITPQGQSGGGPQVLND